MSEIFGRRGAHSRLQARRWAVGLSSCGLLAAGLVAAIPSAHAAESACSSATFSTSGSCTLPTGQSIQFTIKGGNGGSGSPGGQGGSGGNANTVQGGEGGLGGPGGAGGPGAKVTGTIVNNSGTDMVLDVAVGLNGSSQMIYGTDGLPGVNAAGNPAVIPVVSGGNGDNGGDGLEGGAGQDSSITVRGEATALITAQGGQGGLGGQGGRGGEGAKDTAAGGTPGATGATGATGAVGAPGGTIPSPLPSGWSTVSTSGTDKPEVVFGEAQPIPVVKEIMISGSRDPNNIVMIQAIGFTQGLTGETVTPFVRKASEKKFTEGIGKRTIGEDGAFTWQRKSRHKTFVYFASGSVKSNTVTFAAP